MSRFKVHQQPGYILHTRPYSESSLLADIFTREFGRLTLIAKGFRKSKSKAQGLFLGFKPLLIGWTGKGELPILTSIEQHGNYPILGSLEANCGFYANELLLKLLHRHDSHEALFDRYHELVVGLGAGGSPSALLRYFEKNLLQETGFGLVLDHDVDTGEAIDPLASYLYLPQKGPTRCNDNGERTVFGGTLLALQQESLATEVHLKQARWLTRLALDIQLGGKELKSRRIIREMKRYQNRHQDEKCNP